MKEFVLVLLIIVLPALSACGRREEERTVGSELSTIIITNGLVDYDIHEIYIDASDEIRSEDRLAPGEILEPGDTFVLKVGEGSWNIRVVDEDGDSYIERQVDVGPGEYCWEVTPDDIESRWGNDADYDSARLETGDGGAWVTIINNLGNRGIYYVYVDTSDARQGDDRLGTEILMEGDRITVFVESGVYDLRVVDENGDSRTLRKVELNDKGYTWQVTPNDSD